jgi:hypothetical protein
MKETEGESERKFKSKKTIFVYFLINLSSYNLDAIKCVCVCVFSIIIKIITFTVQISN